MSFLQPLFLLGLLAVGIPVVLHLARRRTSAAQPWSSLLFLRPSPPRLDRRRRIEHWLLLLLRVAVVMLLAAAFARPFFTRQLPAAMQRQGVRQLLLIDTSASMRRTGLWPQVQARVAEIARAAGPDDRLAMMTFAGATQILLPFDAWASAAVSERAALLQSKLAGVSPGWGATTLGAALVAAAEAVADDEVGSQSGGTGVAGGGVVRQQQVVLFSDLQAGAQMGALGPAEWPAQVSLRLEKIDGGDTTNVSLQPLPQARDGAPAAGERPKVKLVASAGKAPVVAEVSWADGSVGRRRVSVGPGDSQVIEIPARPAGADPAAVLQVTGDGQEFDNQLAWAPRPAVRSTIVYIGVDAATDAEGSLYFLSRAFPATRLRAPNVQAHRPDDARVVWPTVLAATDLVVLTAAPAPALATALRGYLAAGHPVLFAPRAAVDARAGWRALFDDTAVNAADSWREAPAGREAVLTAVDLSHPLLAPFADGRSADFTKVRFWKHRLVDPDALKGARVLARFDDGTPAWLTVPVGAGLVFVMTAGWNLADSQLALSSKLVPLLWSLLESGAGETGPAAPLLVGDALPVPGPGATSVVRPDGRTVELPAGVRQFTGTDVPGLYRVASRAGAGAGDARSDGGSVTFAVNLAPSESATGPLPLEIFDRAGMRVQEGAAGASSTGASKGAETTETMATRGKNGAANSGQLGTARAAAAAERQRRSTFFAELEARQKSWRWMLLGGLLLLLGEAVLTARRRSEHTA